MAGVFTATPGLTIKRAAFLNRIGLKPPNRQASSGNSARNAANPGGSARLSLTVTVAPNAISARTVARPL